MAIANYDKVELLLGFNGANNSTTIKDHSKNNLSLTFGGSAVISTAIGGKYGGSAAYFNASGNYSQSNRINMASGYSVFAFLGDFTIECWFYPLSFGATWGSYLFSTMNTSAANGWNLYYGLSSDSNKIVFWATGMTTIKSNAAPSLNTWTHVAVVRSGSTVKMYVNGVAQTETTTYSSALQANSFMVGNSGNSASTTGIAGYVDEVMISSCAQYTADFSGSLPGSVIKSISGTVTDDTNAGAARTVRAYPRLIGYPLVSTTSASDGTYSLSVPDVEHNVIVLDNDAGVLYNDLIMIVLPG